MKANPLKTATLAALLIPIGLRSGRAFAAGFDGDADGWEDTVDACPLSPAGAIVDREGCALDEDIDGTADGVDRCPNTPLGAAVDVRLHTGTAFAPGGGARGRCCAGADTGHCRRESCALAAAARATAAHRDACRRTQVLERGCAGATGAETEAVFRGR